MAQATAAQPSAARVGQLDADLLAVGLAGFAALGKTRARPEHEALHLIDLALEDVGDLDVGQVPELGEHECRTLVFGQVREIGEERPEIGALLHHLVEARRSRPPPPRRPSSRRARSIDRQRLRAIA